MNVQTCSNCGESLKPGSKFCSKCGRRVAGKGRTGVAPMAGHWKRDGMIIVGLVVVVTGAYLILREPPPGQGNRGEAQASPPGHDETAEVLANLPDDYGLLVQIGNDLMDKQNFPLAAEVYRRALDKDASSPDVRTDFGACLHAMGLNERALEEFREVMTSHPEHAIASFNMGVVFSGLGNTDSTLYYWEKYVDMDPDGGPAEAVRGWLQELEP